MLCLRIVGCSYALENEAFAPVLAVVELATPTKPGEDTDPAAAFLHTATDFVNTQVQLKPPDPAPTPFLDIHRILNLLQNYQPPSPNPTPTHCYMHAQYLFISPCSSSRSKNFSKRFDVSALLDIRGLIRGLCCTFVFHYPIPPGVGHTVLHRDLPRPRGPHQRLAGARPGPTRVRRRVPQHLVRLRIW